MRFEDQRVLVVERFDRRWIEEGQYLVGELPQEDMCQASALAPSQKYEADGGPGIQDIAQLLLRSEDPYRDRLTFLKAQLIMWLLAATDGHAKSFSLHLLPGGSYRLTPLYDVLSMWPITGHGVSLLDEKAGDGDGPARQKRPLPGREIQRRHFIETARRCGVPAAEFEALIDDIAARVPEAGSNRACPPTSQPGCSKIRNGVMDNTRRLAR